MATNDGLTRSASVTADRHRRHVRHEQFGVRQLDRLRVVGRYDHAHAHARHAPQLGRELVRQADAAVRGRIAGQDALVHGHARPGDALHEGHGRAAVDVGAMVPVLLNDAEHARRRGKAGPPGRDRALPVVAGGAVGRYALLGDGDDDEVHGLQLRGLLSFLLRDGSLAGALVLIGVVGAVGLGVRALHAGGKRYHEAGGEKAKRTPGHPDRTGIS